MCGLWIGFQPDVDPQQFFDQWTEVDLPVKYHCHLNEIIINFNTVYSYDGPNNEMNLLQYISIQNTLAA